MTDRPHRNLVMRLVNRLARRPRPLSADDVLAAARRRARHDDFGDMAFVEPLGVLVESLEREASLSPFGRLLVRENLVNFAANRLRVRRALAAAPHLLERPVRRPIFVLGLPRTGTTLMQGLLSSDPALRPLLCWESFFPAPLASWIPAPLDPRRVSMRLIVRSLNSMAPAIRDIHPLSANEPEECTWLMANTFVSSAFSLMGRIPAYEAWLDGAGERLAVAAYEDYARQLRLLQGNDDRPWILKSPTHLRSLAGLLGTFPDARVIRTHREPESVVASTCSLFATMRGIYSDDVDPAALGGEILEKLATVERRAAAAQAAAGPDRVLDVDFRDVVRDPVGTVRGAYRHFGEDLSPEAERRMRAWLAAHPHPTGHRHALQDYGLDAERVRSRLGGSRTPSTEKVQR